MMPAAHHRVPPLATCAFCVPADAIARRDDGDDEVDQGAEQVDRGASSSSSALAPPEAAVAPVLPSPLPPPTAASPAALPAAPTVPLSTPAEAAEAAQPAAAAEPFSPAAPTAAEAGAVLAATSPPAAVSQRSSSRVPTPSARAKEAVEATAAGAGGGAKRRGSGALEAMMAAAAVKRPRGISGGASMLAAAAARTDAAVAAQQQQQQQQQQLAAAAASSQQQQPPMLQSAPPPPPPPPTALQVQINAVLHGTNSLQPPATAAGVALAKLGPREQAAAAAKLPRLPSTFVQHRISTASKSNVSTAVPPPLVELAVAAAAYVAEERATAVAAGVWRASGVLQRAHYKPPPAVVTIAAKPDPRQYFFGREPAAEVLLTDFREVGASDFPCFDRECAGHARVKQIYGRDVWSCTAGDQLGSVRIASDRRLMSVAPMLLCQQCNSTFAMHNHLFLKRLNQNLVEDHYPCDPALCGPRFHLSRALADRLEPIFLQTPAGIESVLKASEEADSKEFTRAQRRYSQACGEYEREYDSAFRVIGATCAARIVAEALRTSHI